MKRKENSNLRVKQPNNLKRCKPEAHKNVAIKKVLRCRTQSKPKCSEKVAKVAKVVKERVKT